MQKCPTCGHRLEKRKVTFCYALVSAIIKALDYANEKNVNNVEIKKLNLTTSEYARFNDLVRFGLLYRSTGMKNGEYGIHKETVNNFLSNKFSVPKYFLKNPLTGDIEKSSELITVDSVPNVDKVQKDLGVKMTSYEHNEKVSTL